MPTLNRAGAVAPAAKQAKSGGAGLCACPRRWHRFSTCALVPVRYQCHQQFLMGLWPPINYEKFMPALALNFEL